MLAIHRSQKFKKDLKKYLKQPQKIKTFIEVVQILQSGKDLPPYYQDHLLIGNYQGYRECHIEPDFLLIYKIDNHQLKLARIGSHHSLFG